MFVAHPGAAGLIPPGGAAGLAGSNRNSRAAAAAGAVPLGPGLMVWGAGAGKAAGAGAAAADTGKPPLPKPSMRSAAAAAAAPDYSQQPGVHALINPGAVSSGGVLNPGGGCLNPGAALPPGFVPQGEYLNPSVSGGVSSGRSPSPSQGLPAPALNPNLLAQFGGAAAGAAQGFSMLGTAAAAAAGSNGFGGVAGIPDHPASVPHMRRPRSANPPRYVQSEVWFSLRLRYPSPYDYGILSLCRGMGVTIR